MLAKSMRPVKRPTTGIRMPSTSEVTILVKAAPMTTPTARSMTLPRAMKSRNSLTKPELFAIALPPGRRVVWSVGSSYCKTAGASSTKFRGSAEAARDLVEQPEQARLLRGGDGRELRAERGHAPAEVRAVGGRDFV